ncbi:MAG: hypothetical protein ACT4PT_06025 [Methanobacteriota archaeon]
MTQPVPTFAQEAYAVLRTRFGGDAFDAGYLAWFMSRPMVKKTLHVLERAGWIRRVEPGVYLCTAPDEVFSSMVQFRVPGLLKAAARPYAYSDASAVEVWTDYSYIQRSWEHSPYFVDVLRQDLKFWVDHFRRNKVKVFVNASEPALGEFVVLKPRARLTSEEHEGSPVEPLNAAVRFCERNIDTFEYPLAYLMAKYHVTTRATLDKRVVKEAMKAA